MSVAPIRVLHVIQNLNYGGMERLLADLVLRIDPRRFASHVLVFQYLGRFAEGLESHATLRKSEPLGRASMLWPSRLARQIREIGPDVVHSHSGVWYKAARAARMAGVARIIHTEHGRKSPDPWVERLVDGIGARYTDVVAAVSEPLSAQLAATVVKGRCQISVVPNGVDTDRFQPRPDSGTIRRELSIGNETPVIGSIGRLEHIKGYDIMVEAFAKLLASWPAEMTPPVLVLAGDGSQRAALEERVHTLGVADCVHFLGWRDDVLELLSTFTIFTMSSRSEGTSVSLLESMSSGLCPVITRVGGNSAVLGEALEHRLVTPLDPAALAQGWRAALLDQAMREADASVARERVVSSWGLDAMVRRYEELYLGSS
jgi:glycosyltransferase involved in cell wall biosynthesis